MKRMSPEEWDSYVDKVVDAIKGAFQGYADGLTNEIKKDVKSVAKQCLADVKKRSPRRNPGGGDYANGWVLKTEEETATSVKVVIGNPKYYRLTHLLENGHATRNGGRTKAQPHIRPAEEAASKALEKQIVLEVRNTE